MNLILILGRAAILGVVSFMTPRVLMSAGVPLDRWADAMGESIGLTLSDPEARFLWAVVFFIIYSFIEYRWRPLGRLYDWVRGIGRNKSAAIGEKEPNYIAIDFADNESSVLVNPKIIGLSEGATGLRARGNKNSPIINPSITENESGSAPTGRWDSMQAIVWVLSRDANLVKEFKTLSKKNKTDIGIDVEEATEELFLRDRLDIELDDVNAAIFEIREAACRGAITARARHRNSDRREEVHPDEWKHNTLNPYWGYLHKEDETIYEPIWVDVIFEERQFKSRWPVKS